MTILNFASIKNQVDKKAELHFYGDIVGSWWDKWQEEDKTPQEVQDFFKQLNAYDELDIYINSGGGSVFAGIAIYNILKRHQGNKTVYVDGIAASIASVIAMAGDRIVVNAGAMLMIHKPWSYGITGNADELRAFADMLDKIESSLIEIYKSKLKKEISEEQLKKMLFDETWLNGIDAAKIFDIEVAGVEAVAHVEITDSFKNYKNVPDFILNKREVETVKKEEIIAAIAKLSKEDAEVVAKVFQPKTVEKTVDEIRAEVKAEMERDAKVTAFLTQNSTKIKPAIKDKVEVVAKTLAERGELETFEAIFADVKDSLILGEVATGGEAKNETIDDTRASVKKYV